MQIEVTVHSVIKGECSQGFKVGDKWIIEDVGKTPGGMCASAYNAVAPAIRTFRVGGEHPWDVNKNITYVSCPDYKHFVIYEVKRLH